MTYQIERPKFQQLVALLAQRRFHGVVALCWDRLSRNAQDDAVIKNLLAQGVDVRFVQATYDKSSAGALHMDIDGMFAAHYSRVTSEKIRATNAKLRAEGKWTHLAPLGYLDAGSGAKPIDTKRAPIVRRLFELYATGRWSTRQLAAWAKQQGLTTKPRRPNRTAEEMTEGLENAREPVSRPATAKTMESILRNPFYCGLVRHGEEEMPGRHAALITRGQFAAVQSALSKRTRSVHYVDKEFFVYRGLARCVCGRAYSPYRQKGHLYYRASCVEGCGNGGRNISERALDILVADILGRIHLSDEEVAQLTAMAPMELAARERTLQAVGEERGRRRESLRRDLSYLGDNKLSLLRERVYEPASFAAETRRLEEALAAVDLAASASEEKPDAMLRTILEFSELVKVAKDAYVLGLPEERHAIAVKVFLELVVVNQNVAQVRANPGYRHLLERANARCGGPKYVFHELGVLARACSAATRL